MALSMAVDTPERYLKRFQWGPWEPYPVAWTGASSNPAIGNGTLEAWMRRDGALGFLRGHMLAGSTTTFGSGQWRMSLPDGWETAATGLQVGWAVYNDTGTATRRGDCYLDPAGGGLLRFVHSSPWVSVTSTSPHTWANTDYLSWGICFEVADA